MTSRHVNEILCAANPRGSVDAIEQLLVTAEERGVQAVAVVGDLGDADGSLPVLRALGHAQLPVYWVPGPGDAPVDRYLRAAFDVETAFPQLHGIHGTAASGLGNVLFAGMGGEVSDEPDEPREEQARLRYPRWEAEYRLKVVREMKYNELVLLLWTPPEHKGRHQAGSEVIAELVNTYRPRLVVCGGERGVETLGRSATVAPGDLADGHYAIADLRNRTAELQELAGVAP